MKKEIQRIREMNLSMLRSTEETLKSIIDMGEDPPSLMIFVRDQHLLLHNELNKEDCDYELIKRSMNYIECEVKKGFGNLEINMSSN